MALNKVIFLTNYDILEVTKGASTGLLKFFRKEVLACKKNTNLREVLMEQAK